jgi:anti-sigma B factor antagonist
MQRSNKLVDNDRQSLFDSRWVCSIQEVACKNMVQSDIDVLEQDSVTVVVLGSEYDNLDEAQLEATSIRLLEIARDAKPALMLIDMSRTQFFGSAFLGTLFRVWNRLKARSGKLAISHASGICAEVLRVTHVHMLWELFDSNDEAVQKLLSE